MAHFFKERERQRETEKGGERKNYRVNGSLNATKGGGLVQ